jgi:DNA repair protein RadC
MFTSSQNTILEAMLKEAPARFYTQPETNLYFGNGEAPYVLKIRDLPEDEKPREKLIKYGSTVLSVGELLAVILNIGTKKEGVLSMSSRLLKEYGEGAIMSQTDPRPIAKNLNIPLIKACQIVASLELGRRFFKTNKGKPRFLRTAKQVYEYLRDMRELPKEHLRGIYLDNHFRVVHEETISVGSLTANVVHPREVFRPALDSGASAVILAHNHPTGVARPSMEDIAITKQLIEAGKLLGIHLLDHIIITEKAFASVPAEYNN